MQSLTIGKLARSCDVTTDTVRYYETQGLLEPASRTDSGYRMYSADTVKRLGFVKRAQSLGFTLKEIKEMLELSNLPEADCEDIRQRAQAKIDEIEVRIRDLKTIQKSLADLAGFCPGKGKPLSECNILQYFYAS